MYFLDFWFSYMSMNSHIPSVDIFLWIKEFMWAEKKCEFENFSEENTFLIWSSTNSAHCITSKIVLLSYHIFWIQIPLCLVFNIHEFLYFSDETVTCYEKIEDYVTLRQNAKFWLEGVGITISGIFGLAGNFLAVLVLQTYTTNMSFNRLLISLAIVDSLLISDMMVQKAIIGKLFLSAKIQKS